MTIIIILMTITLMTIIIILMTITLMTIIIITLMTIIIMTIIIMTIIIIPIIIPITHSLPQPLPHSPPLTPTSLASPTSPRIPTCDANPGSPRHTSLPTLNHTPPKRPSRRIAGRLSLSQSFRRIRNNPLLPRSPVSTFPLNPITHRIT